MTQDEKAYIGRTVKRVMDKYQAGQLHLTQASLAIADYWLQGVLTIEQTDYALRILAKTKVEG